MIDREVRDVPGGGEPRSARTKGSVHTRLEWARPRTPRCDGSQAAAPPTRRLTIPVPLRPGARDSPIDHLVLRSGGSLMIGRAKIEHGKDAGSPDIDDIGATEDTARRRFAAARARETFGTEH